MPVLVNPSRFAVAGGGGSAFQTAVLALSPLVYARCGEASGTTMVDTSANGRNGTWTGSPTFGTTGLVTGDPDTAVTLSGSTQYAEVASGAWADASHFTVMGIIKTSASGASNGYNIVDRHRSSTGKGFQFRIEGNGKLSLYLINSGGVLGGFAQTSGTLNNGVQHFVVGTCDGTNLKLYVDGSLSVTTANANGQPSTSGDGVRFGANRAGVSDAIVTPTFNGVLDEGAYIGTAITSTDVSNLWALI